MVREIVFSNSPMVGLVDDEDFDRVMSSPNTWYVRPFPQLQGEPLVYAYRRRPKNSPHKQLHRFILDAPPDMYVDHANGNGLDNRRCNLRLATNSQNQANRRCFVVGSSQFRGVCWNQKSGKWQAGIKVNGRSQHLGLFDREVDAAAAYNQAAIEAFGEFCRLNDLEAA